MTLEVSNGSYAYKNREVFSNVNFSVSSGELLAVLGPNGAGKTTLLKCVMGILRWKSGAAALDSRNIETFTPRELWRKLAYVPQAKQPAPLKVREMVVLGRSTHISPLGKPSNTDYAKADAALERLYISSLANQECGQISGGELQLALIARALTGEPDVLILDEPESNLDFRNQLRILEIIKEIANDKICVFNTHYPEHALRIADKALLMSGGEKCIFGFADEIITERNLSGIFGISVSIGEVAGTRVVVPARRLR